MQKFYKPTQAGFSLVELSIVLVILGLLVAGVIAGSTLVRNAELRAVTTEFNSIRTNINAFKTSYDYLPGDIKNASDFWPQDAANCDNASIAEMDGDFNGHIDFATVDGRSESYMAWCHLRLAGLASGPFQGNPAAVATPVIGTDIPSSKVEGGGYLLSFGAHEMTDSNVVVLGGVSGVTVDAEMILKAVLTPRDARNVDTKIDDGTPTSGIVRGFDGDGVAAEDCVVAGAVDTFNVGADPQPISCGLAFRIN